MLAEHRTPEVASLDFLNFVLLCDLLCRLFRTFTRFFDSVFH